MPRARGAILNQDGMEYTSGNIDALLLARYTARKIRMDGGWLKGPSKRTNAQDGVFAKALENLLRDKNFYTVLD